MGCVGDQFSRKQCSQLGFLSSPSALDVALTEVADGGPQRQPVPEHHATSVPCQWRTSRRCVEGGESCALLSVAGKLQYIEKVAGM